MATLANCCVVQIYHCKFPQPHCTPRTIWVTVDQTPLAYESVFGFPNLTSPVNWQVKCEIMRFSAYIPRTCHLRATLNPARLFNQCFLNATAAINKIAPLSF